MPFDYRDDEGVRTVTLPQARFGALCNLMTQGVVRHVAYNATLAEAHATAAYERDPDRYRRALGRATEIPGLRLVGDPGDPETLALARPEIAEKLAALKEELPKLASLARWEAFQSPVDRLPLDQVTDAITHAEAARGTLTNNWKSHGYYAGFNYYISMADMLAAQALTPPPPTDSPEQTADLDAVRAARDERTPARVARVQADAEMSVFRMADALGEGFTPEKVPFAAGVLHQAFIDGDNAINALKRGFNRPRPFMVDPSIETIVEQPPNASYPSGHSTFAHLNARLLARAMPEKAEALAARAEEYARNRIVAGVHFPTDIEGGRRSAEAIDKALTKDPGFAADFARARIELRHALGLPREPAPPGEQL